MLMVLLFDGRMVSLFSLFIFELMMVPSLVVAVTSLSLSGVDETLDSLIRVLFNAAGEDANGFSLVSAIEVLVDEGIVVKGKFE